MSSVRALLLVCSLAAAIAAEAQSQIRTLSIRVIAPASTPAGAQLYVTGITPEMGEWDPGTAPMLKENDSLWTFSCPILAGLEVQFKITRGSWSTEAMYVDKVVPPNTTLRMRFDTTVVLKPVAWKDLAVTEKRSASAGGITGSVRFHRALKGEGLRYERDLIVWLPPSYENNIQKRYPVLYMHDGQNVFDPATSFLGWDWRADEVADSLIKARAIEEIIIVGIYNTADRMSEYSDTPAGRSYAKFVVERVKPLIDSIYRTKPSRENTAVMGSSLGGLISLCFAWWYPDVFSKAGCLSTTVLPGSRDEVLKEIRAYRGPKKNVRLYFDVGGKESSLLSGFKALASMLKEKGYEEGKDMEFFLDEGAVHNEIAWSHRLWRPMKFLFGQQ